MELSGRDLDGLVGQLAAILESDTDPDSEEDEGEDKDQALVQEKDEVKEKLACFEHVSQTLLAELSTLEAEYETEKSCREQAETYAAQMSRENKNLKWISTTLLPLLSHLPGDLMNLGNAEEAPSETAEDLVGQYQEQIKDLQAKVSRLLGEKKELALQVKELRDQLQWLQDKLEEEAAEKQSMRVLMEQRQRAWKTVKQTSCLVAQENHRMAQQLDLEKELRQEAETFAHLMLVKQKEANRQSVILMQNVGPDARLLHALEEVADVTRALEGAKREHQARVKDLEAQLARRPQQEEMQKLQQALALAEAEKDCLEKRLVHMEESKAALEERVRSLEEGAKLTNADPSPGACPTADPPPPPPPPPLPPPLIPSAPMDPLMAIRQRRAVRLVRREVPRNDDVKAKAVEEMMARIKGGVVLRSVGRDAGDSSRLPSTPASKRRSTVVEFQVLLNTVKKPSRRSSQRKSLWKKLTDDQLESILQRRRRMVDCPAETPSSQMQPTATTECTSSGGAPRATAQGVCSSLKEPPSPAKPKQVIPESLGPHPKDMDFAFRQTAASLRSTERICPILATPRQ
ncbi:shootin-1 isoform X1 [Pogona vitticeps]